jgi:plasmid stabilization system protein ParE
MSLEWSARALADLDRFALFLQDHYPALAALVAREILAKAQVLEAHPQLGRPIGRHGRYRQVVLEVLRAEVCLPLSHFRRTDRHVARLA